MIAVLLCAAVPVGVGHFDAPAAEEQRPLERHLRTAILHMDAGMRSAEYRESIAYLRDHAAEAAVEVTGVLLEEPGSFRKWQVTYLLGEFGDESALELLRRALDAPLPAPRPPPAGTRAIDLRLSEEVTSRFQAVMSIGEIAAQRPHLRDQVVASLVDIGRNIPMATSAAIFELRTLLGDDAQAFRDEFGPEHAYELDRFLPPPEWQGLLAERMRERHRLEREARERRVPVCKLD